MAPVSAPSFFNSDARKFPSDSSRLQVSSCTVLGLGLGLLLLWLWGLQSPNPTNSERQQANANGERKSWSVDETLVEAVTRREDVPAQKLGRNLCDFSDNIVDSILVKLDYKTLFQVKAVSKFFRARIEDDGYHCYRESQKPREALLTGLHFSVRNDNVWRCVGYDLDTQTWRKLLPFAMLPRLDTNSIKDGLKDHSICGAGGLLCFYVSAVRDCPRDFQKIAEKMVVLNPLTKRWRELPPLNHPRNPVLMQMVVASTGDYFKVIVAGSAWIGELEHRSKITEVFDSRTSMWSVSEDVPGLVFALNEHQNGAYMNGFLYCVASLDGDRGQGLLAYSVEEEKWFPNLACPVPTTSNLNMWQISMARLSCFRRLSTILVICVGLLSIASTYFGTQCTPT